MCWDPPLPRTLSGSPGGRAAETLFSPPRPQASRTRRSQYPRLPRRPEGRHGHNKIFIDIYRILQDMYPGGSNSTEIKAKSVPFFSN